MVSADNLPLDIIITVFENISSRNDLVSLSLGEGRLSKAIDIELYRNLYIRSSWNKQSESVAPSPFVTILSRTFLANYVRSCVIQSVPMKGGAAHPKFIVDCTRALELCDNLVKFSCSTPIFGSTATPTIFRALKANKPRLADLHFLASTVTRPQAEFIASIKGLKSLSVNQPSKSVVKVLPTWVEMTKETLKSLSIVHSPDLNEVVLDQVLSKVPTLRALHLRACSLSHHSVIPTLEHTPDLETLTLTTWENASLIEVPPCWLPLLQHIYLDSYFGISPRTDDHDTLTQLWSNIFTSLSMSPLATLTLKLTNNSTHTSSLGLISPSTASIDEVMRQIVSGFGGTLRKLNVVGIRLSSRSVAALCKGCTNLEQFSFEIPPRGQLAYYVLALKGAEKTLHTLIDVKGSEPHEHGAPTSELNASDIKELFVGLPNLKRVLSGKRTWECLRTGDDVTVTAHRLGNPSMVLTRRL